MRTEFGEDNFLLESISSSNELVLYRSSRTVKVSNLSCEELGRSEVRLSHRNVLNIEGSNVKEIANVKCRLFELILGGSSWKEIV